MYTSNTISRQVSVVSECIQPRTRPSLSTGVNVRSLKSMFAMYCLRMLASFVRLKGHARFTIYRLSSEYMQTLRLEFEQRLMKVLGGFGCVQFGDVLYRGKRMDER
jgi:hypothetical protein